MDTGHPLYIQVPICSSSAVAMITASYGILPLPHCSWNCL